MMGPMMGPLQFPGSEIAFFPNGKQSEEKVMRYSVTWLHFDNGINKQLTKLTYRDAVPHKNNRIGIHFTADTLLKSYLE